MKDKLQELLDYLESVHMDEKERYVSKVNDGLGNSYNEIMNRKQYLEFVVEISMNDIMNMIDDLEDGAS